MDVVNGRRAILLVMFMIGCAGGLDDPFGEGAYSEHGEASDLNTVVIVDGKGDSVSANFDKHFIVSDPFFLDGDALDAAQIQGFLDNTPYGGSSWLASEFLGDRRASHVIAETSRRRGVNPLMILSRFQVEGSHISKSRRPSNASVNRALGCGCFDGQSCQSSFLGLDKQINCAAETLQERFEGSANGTWEWRRGRTESSLDGHRITPRNHATAALYAYTPWVLPRRGGNWLVWNVTKKYINHIESLGFDNFGDDGEPWVGTPCETDADCDFVDGENFGFCYDFVDNSDASTRGFCSLVCEGLCPDRPGEATTFCIAADVAEVGICASKSEAPNQFCADIPGTLPADRERFVGTSGVSVSVSTVCAPNI